MNNTARWISERLKEYDFIREARPQENTVRVVRDSHPEALIGVLSTRDVERADARSLLEANEGVGFVLNLPKEGRFMGDAIVLLREKRIGWGGLGDAIRALRDCEVLGDYEERELTFVIRGLRQHRAITDFTLLDDHRILVIRRGLPDLVIYIGSEYQPTAHSVRSAIDRFGQFDIFAATNPNSDPTVEATEVAELGEIRVLKWRETLAALHK
ncbi:hypothetical protein [Nesterenkonia sandarakina]|nr:hypothetical protein [Nesterenkonia sandarakina]